jgi:UDP-N-acetylmuramyl tripeptide synthase
MKNDKIPLRFWPALWVCRILIRHTQRSGRVVSDRIGILARRLCPRIERYLRRPGLVVLVTGTNGKTSTVNLINDTLKADGLKTACNDTGYNDYGGEALTMLMAVDWRNRPIVDAMVVEASEHIAPKTFPVIDPDFIVVTNLTRDSLFRNATPDYIFSLVDQGCRACRKAVLVLNADDPISSMLAPENPRILVSVDDLHTPESRHVVSDFTVCPRCHHLPRYHYRNYRDIGSYYCPECGYHNPDSQYRVRKAGQGRMTVASAEGEYEVPLVGSSGVYNIYNTAMVMALLRQLGYSPQRAAELLEHAHVPQDRENQVSCGKITVYVRMAKTHNATAVSSVLEAISREPGVKNVIFLMDELLPDYKMEVTCWIWDADYEFLNRPDIRRVIIAGPRSADQKLRLLMAGIPEERIVVAPSVIETPDQLDLEGVDAVYIVRDMYLPEQLRGQLRDKTVETVKRWEKEHDH